MRNDKTIESNDDLMEGDGMYNGWCITRGKGGDKMMEART